MLFGSRVESEWRVEGESHSLTEAFPFLAIATYHDARGKATQPSESIMGLFKGARRF